MFHAPRTKPNRKVILGGLVLFFCLLSLPGTGLSQEEQEDNAVVSDTQTSASDTFAPATAIKNYYVDPYTGSANFTIPIFLPPARKNLPLKLNLVYSSRARNGWLGVGWKLDLGVIERSTKNGYPKYDSSDKFIFSLGQQQNDLVFIGGQEYRPKTADIAWKFIFDGNRWTVKDNLGNTYYFGLDNYLNDYSRTKDPNSPNKIFRWRLSKVTDPSGNSIIYKYLSDKIEIYYTEKSESAKGSYRKEDYNYLILINFSHNREDTLSNCRAGFNDDYPLDGKGRVGEIKILYRNQLVRRYDLEYKYSTVTGRSILEKITEYGSDNITKNPPIKFDYNRRNGYYYNKIRSNQNLSGRSDNLWNVRFSSIQQPTGARGPYPIDWVSPLGLVRYGNIIAPVQWGQQYIKTNGSYPGLSWSTTSTGNITIVGKKGQAFHIWTYLLSEDSKFLFIPVTDNCNAKVFISDLRLPWTFDSIQLNRGSYVRIDITGYSFDRDFLFQLNLDLSREVKIMTSQEPILPQLSGDFNGDGVTDLGSFIKKEGKCEIFISNKAGFKPKEKWINNFGNDDKVLLGDFNGDGKTDLCAFDSSIGSFRVALSDGQKFIDKGIWLSNFHKNSFFSTADFNGDGLTDIYSLYFQNTQDIYVQAAFSNGRGFQPQPPFFLVSNFILDGIVKISTGDFNGDGITDFYYEGGRIRGYNNQWSRNLPDPLLFGSNEFTVDFDSDGRSDLCAYSGGGVGGTNNIENGFKYIGGLPTLVDFDESLDNIQSGDFNGDGVTDFCAYNGLGEMQIAMLTLDIYSDLLISTDNGWGGSINLDYKPSLFYENRSSDESKLPFSIPVISSVSINNIAGNFDAIADIYKTEYIYSGGYYDIDSKEFRGFGYSLAIDPEGNLTETWFLQDDICKGKISQQKVSNKEGEPFLKVKNTWTNSSPFTGIHIVSLSEINQYTYDGDSSFKQKKTTFQYDSHGNQIRIKELGDVNINGDERETTTEYVYNTRDWLVSYPSHIYTQDATGKKVNEKWLYYDGASTATAPTKGLLTKEVNWLYNPLTKTSNLLPTTYSYDTFGNVTKITDSVGRITTTEYDQDLHTYPAKVTNALGHITKYTYDQNTGQILTITDSNNQTTKNVYDTLGRLTKVIGTDDSDENPGVIYEYRMPYTYNLIDNGSFDSWEYVRDVWDKLVSKPVSWNEGWFSGWDSLSREEQDKKDGIYSLRFRYNATCIEPKAYYNLSTESLRGKTVTYGCWVKAFKPNKVSIDLYEGNEGNGPASWWGVWSDNSPTALYHPGNGEWELLTITREIRKDPVSVGFTTLDKISTYFDGAFLYEGSRPFEPIKIIKKTKTSYNLQNPDYLTEYLFYDGLGRLIQTKSPAEDNPQTNKPRQIVSDVVKYDHRGLVIEKYLPYFANSSGYYRQDFTNEPKFTYEYDCLGRLTKTANPDSTYTQRSYSDWTTTFIDENGHRTKQTLDAYARIVKVEEYNDTQVYATIYRYNTLDNLTQITDNQGNSTYFIYDTLGRKLKTNDPDMSVWTYEYDKVGNLIKQTDARGQIIDFTYDALNRIKTKKLGGRFLAQYTYDDTSKQFSKGRLSKVTDTSGSSEYFYDKLGRQTKSIKVVSGSSYTTENTYDALDRVVKLRYPDGITIGYVYNKAGQIEKILNGAREIVKNVDYSPTNQITRIEYKNNTITNYTYDPNTLRIKQILTESPAGRIQDLDYTFDNVGNVLNIRDHANTSTQEFLYDGLNRLIQAQGSYGSFTYSYDSLGNITHKEGKNYAYNRIKPHAVRSTSDGTRFEYDENGNLIKKSKGAIVESFIYNNENRLIKVQSQDNSSAQTTISMYLSPGMNYIPSLKENGGRWVYIDNPRGIILSIPADKLNSEHPTETKLNLAKEILDFLIGMDYAYANTQPFYTQPPPITTQQVSTLAQFTYDSQGNRVKKISGSKTTIYIGSLFEKDSNGTTRKHIFLGTNRIATITTGTVPKTLYYHSDHLGSSNVITDASGKQVQLAEYLPFGSFSKIRPNQAIVKHYFNSKELDTQTSLYHYGARYYNPALGRFIQPDPIIQDVYDPQNLNHYAYCRNNPLILTDPTGLAWRDTWNSFSGGWNNFWGGVGSWASNTWNSFSSFAFKSINTFTTFSMQAFSSIGSTFSSFGSSLWQGTSTFGSALGMGMSYGLGQIGSGLMNFQQDLFRSQVEMWRGMGSAAIQGLNQFTSLSGSLINDYMIRPIGTGLNTLWNYGYIDIGVSFGIPGRLGGGFNTGLQISSRGLYWYYGTGIGVGAGASATLNIGTPPAPGIDISITGRGGAGWGYQGSFGFTQTGTTGGIGGGFGIFSGTTITINRTVELIRWRR